MTATTDRGAAKASRSARARRSAKASAERPERGTALLAALMVTCVLMAIAAVLVSITIAETMTSANYRIACQTAYAADAGIERTVADVRATADWSTLVAGLATSGFDDGAAMPVSPEGKPLDLAAMTAALQAASDAASGADPDAPAWRLFGHAHVSRLLPAGTVATPAYVVVWVADDPADGDGNPGRDANGVLLLAARAFGGRGAVRGVQATVVRAGPVVRLTSWQSSWF